MVVVAAGVLAAVRYGPLIDEVRGLREAAQRLATDARALEPVDVDRESVERLRGGLSELDGRLAPVRDLVAGDPLVGLARALPIAGTQVRSADALVDAAGSLVEAGQLGLSMADRFVGLREANAADPGFPLMPGLVELMATSTDEVDRIGELVTAADASLADISPEAASQIREARDLVAEPLARYGPLLERYREVDDVLPGLLGWGDEKRYLVLAQNPAELRPGGGYAGTVGIIAFRDGVLTEQRFQDVNELDLQQDLPFIEAPAELSAYLLGSEQSWRLADAAWSADFPTGAQKALEFYALETDDGDLDGVIGITTFALDRLLEVVGPVSVPEHGVTVEAGDTTMTLLGATRGGDTPETVFGRKEILDVLGRTVMQRLLALPADQWLPTAEALLDIGEQKMAVAWFEDPAAQELVVEGGWAGAVRQDPGDYVYALESNVAPTSKYNLVVDRSASFVVDLDESGDALSSLRLDWQNPADRSGEPYASLREFSVNEEGWYGAYLRLLVPGGSTLVTASGEASDEIRGADELPAEAGKAVFGNYLFMPPGESTLSYLWTSPGAAMPLEAAAAVGDGGGQVREYRLLVQKQPGARPQPWRIRIDLPRGAEVIELPDSATAHGERVALETTLTTDLELRLVYRLPSDAGPDPVTTGAPFEAPTAEPGEATP